MDLLSEYLSTYKCIVYFAISVQTLFKHEPCVLPKFIWSTRHLEMINPH